jgi:hypothetical protein
MVIFDSVIFDSISANRGQPMPTMKDSDLLFNVLTAAALGVFVTLAPSAARSAAGEVPGLYISGRSVDSTPAQEGHIEFQGEVHAQSSSCCR